MPDEVPVVVIATILNPTGPTGVQSHFSALRDYLRERGRNSMLVTPFDAPGILVYPTFAARRIIDLLSGPASVWWYRYWHEFFLRVALRRVLAAHANVVVYAQCPLSARAAMRVRRYRTQGVTMVVHFNGSQADEWSDQGKIQRDGRLARHIRRTEAAVLPALDGIVYVSRYMRRQLEERFPALNNVRSEVIPNFSRSGTAKPGRPTIDIVNVGTLEPRKNQQFLLAVLAEAKRAGHRFTLALIGDGPDRQHLERISRESGVAEQVRFCGNLPHAIDRMSCARLYAHSARMENLPLALIEAMACGLPILAPAVGGITDMFENGNAGYFWDIDDVQMSAKLMINLLNDPEHLESMSRAARSSFEQRFDTNRVAGQLYEFIVARVEHA